MDKIKILNNLNDYISVIITAYDRRDYIKQALNSLMQQTVNAFETIVVTNFEMDLSQFNKLNPRHIVVPKDQRHLLFRGILEARGNILAFLEDDDLFLPNKIEWVYKVFRERGVVYYHNDYRSIDAHGNKIVFRNEDNYFNLSCVSVKKNIINAEIMKNIWGISDFSLFVSALISKGRIIHDSRVLTVYRLHSSNNSRIEIESFEEFKKNGIYLHRRFLFQLTQLLLLINDDLARRVILYKILDEKFTLMLLGDESVNISIRDTVFFLLCSTTKVPNVLGISRFYPVKIFFGSTILRFKAVAIMYNRHKNFINVIER
jgi:glycosyltransferase involved in cell wall biosynthesis